MNGSVMRKFCALWVLLLLMNGLVFSQYLKPKHVVARFTSEEENYEDDLFLEKLAYIASSSLDASRDIEIYQRNFVRKYPVQYFLKVIASNKYYIWKGSFHYSHIDPQKEIMYFQYQMNYAPKTDLILGNVSTGAITNFYRIQTQSVFPPETIGVPYTEIGYKKGMSLEKEDQKKYIEAAKISLRVHLRMNTIAAEKVAWKEMQNAAYYAQFHFFPIRAQVLNFSPVGKEGATASIPGLDDYDFSPYHAFYVYLLKEYKDETGTFERIELLETLVTGGKKGTFLRDKPNHKIEEALQKGETVWCSPLKLQYTSVPKEAPPTIAVNLRAPGYTIEPMTMAILSTRLNMDVLDVRGKYLTLLDRKNRHDIQWTQRDNKKDSKIQIDQQYVAQFKSLGCRYVLDAEIKTLRYSLHNGSYIFYADYILRLIDTETGEVVSEVVNKYSKTWWHIKLSTAPIDGAEFDMIQAATKDRDKEKIIYDLGLKYLEFNIREIINKALPAKIKVNEITEAQKGKAKQLFISGNFNERITKDDYHVCIQKEVAVDGKMETRWEQIGRIDIASSIGDGLALARVKKGEAEIYAAFQKGEKLYCFDRPELLIDGDYKWQLKKAGF